MILLIVDRRGLRTEP